MAQNTIRPTDDDARALARRLLRTARSAALGTLESGHPSASLTTVATDFDGAPIILVSRLSGHTANLLEDARCSLLIAQAGRGDPLAHPRMTLFAQARFLERAEAAANGVRRRFLALNPKAELYVDFPDFAFASLQISRASLNGGFGRAYELAPDDVLSETSDADGLRDVEEQALAHLNRDHAEALALYAVRLCRMPEGAWRAVSIDPEGVVLQAGDMITRLEFDAHVTTSGGLRSVLKSLAEKAATPARQP